MSTKNKNMKDLMLDIETLGVSNSAVITQIGACYFDRITGEVGDTFIVNIDIEDSMKHGRTIDGSTIKWWFERPHEQVTFLGNTQTLQNALSLFSDFAKKSKQVWSHATFDAPIVADAYKTIGLKLPFHYTASRDIRTLIDISHVEKNDTYHTKSKTHYALDDCLYQVEYCVTAFRKLESCKI